MTKNITLIVTEKPKCNHERAAYLEILKSDRFGYYNSKRYLK